MKEHVELDYQEDDGSGNRVSLGQWWIALLKVHMLATSILVGPAVLWMSWVTLEVVRSQEFRTSAERYQSADRNLLHQNATQIEFLVSRFTDLEKEREIYSKQMWERLDRLDTKLNDIQRQVDKALKER